MLKLASWNVNSLRVRLPHLLDWLAQQQPDLVGLQETKLTDEQFPFDELQAAGYQVVCSGQKTYNGVAVLSRQALTEIERDFPNYDDPQRRLLAVTCGELRFINVYAPNGSEVGCDKFRYKLDWLDALHGYLEAQLQQYPRLALVGDFNIAPEDRDVHDPQAWQGMVLVSEAERKQFHRLLKLGLVDTFRQFEQAEASFSWWDYRAAAFRRNHGLRIDHILASPALAATCRSSQIDKIPRKLERPSDHAPVIAEFE